MALILFSGRPRTGKTRNAVKFVLEHYVKRGIPCYSNISLRLKGEYDRSWKTLWLKKYYYDPKLIREWFRLEELYSVSNCVILMDEGHIYMNARKWEKLPEEFQWKLFQHGKDRIDLVMTVQSHKRLDTVARELVDYWYECTRWPKARSAVRVNKPWIFSFREYNIDEDQKREFQVGMTHRSLPRKKWYRRYDTMQKLRN